MSNSLRPGLRPGSSFLLQGVSIHSLLKKDECANIDGQGPSCKLASKNRNTNDGQQKSRLRKVQAQHPQMQDCIFLNRPPGLAMGWGWQTPMRLGKASPQGKALLRLGWPSGQGKALWKTAICARWAPIFDAAKLRQMVLGTKCRIPYPRNSAFSAFVF